MAVSKIPEGEIYSKITIGKDGSESFPPVVFIHAAIADHTMWGAQVEHLSARGITCVQYDIFGFGLSKPSQEYLDGSPRSPIDYISHIHDLVQKSNKSATGATSKVIIVGLSMGGGLALRFATLNPKFLAGVIIAAGNVPGYDPGVWPEEEQNLDEAIEAAVDKGEIENAAQLVAHYWGDGPREKEGRCPSDVRQALYKWFLDIGKRQHDKTGGFALPTTKRSGISNQTLASLDMPFGVAIGDYDETMTKLMMEHLGTTVKNASVHRFDAAHMINLECPEEFNEWIYSWIKHEVVKHPR